MQKFEIAEDLAQAVLNYLAQRPYREVADLIAALQRMQRIEATAPAAPPREGI